MHRRKWNGALSPMWIVCIVTVERSRPYLPDRVETMERLLERRVELAALTTFQFADARRTTIAILRRQSVWQRGGRRRHLPLPGAASPVIARFNETVREMGEMISIWRQPLRLLDSKLRQFLREVPARSLDERRAPRSIG